MRQPTTRYGGVRQQAMTGAQAARLRRLSEEACRPQQFQPGLSQAEAKQRIAALQAEIELADSF